VLELLGSNGSIHPHVDPACCYPLCYPKWPSRFGKTRQVLARSEGFEPPTPRFEEGCSRMTGHRLGRKVAIPRGDVACPVEAVKIWREAAGITEGAPGVE
jgi:hypothetical protein